MLAIDIMYINQIPFMMMISRAIHFGTAELIKTKIFKYISCQRVQNTAYFGRWAIQKRMETHRGNWHNAQCDRIY